MTGRFVEGGNRGLRADEEVEAEVGSVGGRDGGNGERLEAAGLSAADGATNAGGFVLNVGRGAIGGGVDADVFFPGGIDRTSAPADLGDKMELVPTRLILGTAGPVRPMAGSSGVIPSARAAARPSSVEETRSLRT